MGTEINRRQDVPYYTVGGLEFIDILKAKMTAEQYKGFLLGNTFKYLFRYQHKGERLDDLLKAKIYLGWLIEEER